MCKSGDGLLPKSGISVTLEGARCWHCAKVWDSKSHKIRHLDSGRSVSYWITEPQLLALRRAGFELVYRKKELFFGNHGVDPAGMKGWDEVQLPSALST
jgi:hypothetical protein